MRLFRQRRPENREWKLGDQARDAGQWRDAAAHYEKATESEPGNPALWVQYGHALKESGEVAASERAYRRALTLAPAAADTHVQLGHALKLQGRIAEAAAAYRSAAALAPEVADTPWQLGHALELQGERAEAAAAYRRTLDLAPGMTAAHVQLGHMLKALGRREEAVAAYLDALTLAPDLSAPLAELYRLAWVYSELDTAAIARARRKPRRAWPASPQGGNTVARSVVFDISDLLQYFLHARAPSGIQRVMIAVITDLLRRPARDCDLIVAALSAGRDRWVAVPEPVFLRLGDLALAGGAIDDPLWLAAWSELYFVLAEGERLAFRRGAALVNLGASWWLPDYFRLVGLARSHGARYIPFVHDCIPALTPEHCDPVLARRFAAWLDGIFAHADGFLVNSRATAADLATVAGRLGHTAPKPAIIRLDACGSRPQSGADAEREILAGYGLAGRDFVLFVSTIESRKNHPMAFAAWQTLIDERGLEKAPMLVCVGNPGWRFAAILERLRASPALQGRVLILSNISDAALGALYRHCLFTLYPSCVEGWGLPVTESLCHGKVPLIARTSSLPEAGGDLAVYFDPASETDFREQLLRLIDEVPYRRGREERIVRAAALRNWAQVADEVIAGALGDASIPGDYPGADKPRAIAG